MSKVLDIKDYYKPLTCTDSAGNIYVCLNQYEATAIAALLEHLEENPALNGVYNTGDWFRDIPWKIRKVFTDPNLKEND